MRHSNSRRAYVYKTVPLFPFWRRRSNKLIIHKSLSIGSSAMARHWSHGTRYDRRVEATVQQGNRCGKCANVCVALAPVAYRRGRAKVSGLSCKRNTHKIMMYCMLAHCC